MKRNKIAFTLVELIVVITILAILATIGFVSFSGFLGGSRDVNRISQLKSMNDALVLYSTKKSLPIPDDKVDVNASGTTLSIQGDIGKNTLETIEYTESGLDPKYKEYFTYQLTENKKYFQLMAFLEEPNTDIVSGASAADYSDKYPFVKGQKLGILLDDTNNPINKVDSIKTAGKLDLKDLSTDVYKMVISNDEDGIKVGSGTTLAIYNIKGSCKRIKQIKGSSDDGTYKLDPEADGTYVNKECEMITQGGGWEYLGKDGESITLTESGSVLYINSQKDYDIVEKNGNFTCSDSDFSAIGGNNKKCYVRY